MTRRSELVLDETNVLAPPSLEAAAIDEETNGETDEAAPDPYDKSNESTLASSSASVNSAK